MFEGMVEWPSDTAAHYAAKGYWRRVVIGDVLDQAVRLYADHEAVIDGERRITYRQLGALVERLALHFAERGICEGRRIVFQLANSLEGVIAYFACLKVGAIPIACLPAHRHSEIEHVARFTEAHAWLIPSEHRGFDFIAMAEELQSDLPAMRQIIVVGDRCARGMTLFSGLLDDPIEVRRAASSLGRLKPEAEAPAVFQLSGGSTGLPKIIPRTHNDYLYNSYLLAARSGFDAGGVALIAIPMMHNFPLAGAVQPGLLSGSKIVLARRADAQSVCDLIERERVTWICAVPAMVIDWLNAPGFLRADLTSLKSLAVGGARLNPEPARRVLAELGPVLTQVYGMAEGLCCTTRPDDPQEVIIETQGRPVSEADEFKIVDSELKEVAPGDLGELITRGPYTIRGYYKAPEHNRTAFTADGFYRTGDMVRLHASGNFIVEGRTKDLINRGGEKISAEEIENLILTHPAVSNTAVVAMPDPVLGERTCAYVVLHNGASLELGQLCAFLEQKRIARFKLPERLEVIDALPTTAVDKISKKDLRERIIRTLEQEARRSA
ncbi:MAG: AMP-binding protein [Deltaproteobacteria bacterium]|nr:AMP-binding protein [Deltaproteobacteria bacterium]